MHDVEEMKIKLIGNCIGKITNRDNAGLKSVNEIKKNKINNV